MSSNGSGHESNPLGIRPMAEVRIRIPKVPGFSEEALAQMVQLQMGQIQPWAPLSDPQALGDAAARVVGDLPAMQAITTSLLDVAPGTRWRMTLLRPLQVTAIGDDAMATVLLVLEAPGRFSECHTTDDLASFLTMVGYLTSGTMRGLTALQGCYARFELLPPSSPESPPGDGES